MITPRVCVVGSGPAGFYTAIRVRKLIASSSCALINTPRIDVVDRLPVPYGLVRYGVAPDHMEVKVEMAGTVL